MLAVYVKNEDGTLERIAHHGISRQAYLDWLNEGIPQEHHFKATGEDDLMGWPESKVEWYGHVGFGVK